MTHQALARKYRPKTFAEIVGQHAVVTALTNALDKQILHHAYLFTGTRGVGKTTLARLFAKSLNCKEGISSKPCGVCDHCREIDAGNFIDLYEIDAASRTKVEDTRDLLDKIPYAPNKGRYKVYLIDEVHMLSTHSFNALLKTLEEPPEHVKFILATTELDKLPATILSRCLQFHLLHLQPQEIESQLQHVLGKEHKNYEPEALGLIATAAEGSMRDALSLLDQAIAFSTTDTLQALPLHQLYGTTPQAQINALWQSIADKNYGAITQTCADLNTTGADFSKILSQLAKATYLKVMSATQSPETKAMQDLHRLFTILTEGKTALAYAPNRRIGFEMCLLRAASMYQLEPSAQVITAPQQTAAPKPATPAQVKPAPVAQKAVPTPAKPKLSLPILSWGQALQQLNLSPATRMLATNCTLSMQNTTSITLALATKHRALLNHQQIKTIQAALSDATGQQLKVNITCQEAVQDTPQQIQTRQNQQATDSLKLQMASDPAVQSLQTSFGATMTEVSQGEKSTT
jgi:DNA polymerase-3 subunit gamma/tau